MGGCQKVVLLHLSMSDSKTSAHPSSTLTSPCVAHTLQAVAWQLSSSVVASQQRNTTLGAVVARERLYPRTSHLRPLGMSATLPDRVRRVSLISTRVCCDFSAYRLYPATSWERRSISLARRLCSSLCCCCSASSWAQARRCQPLAFAESRMCWRRFSRFLVKSIEIAQPCAISGTSWRWKTEVSMPTAWHLLALQTHETKAESSKRVLGPGPFGCNCVGHLLAAKIVPAWASLV